jgi:hypothetical protein
MNNPRVPPVAYDLTAIRPDLSLDANTRQIMIQAEVVDYSGPHPRPSGTMIHLAGC